MAAGSPWPVSASLQSLALSSRVTLPSVKVPLLVVLFFSFFYCLFIFERKRQNASGAEAEREGDAESKTGSRLRAVSTEPDAGVEPTNVRS